MSTFIPDYIRFGLDGLDLSSAADVVPGEKYGRLTNLRQVERGAWQTRPGLTSLATAGTHHHTIARLNDPQGATFTRIFGIDTHLYYGQAGALTQADTGYSGSPLALVQARPPLSGDSWMYVGDSSRMRKIRADGLDVAIGLAAPAAAITTALAAEATVAIDDFSAIAGWVPQNGSGGAAGNPTVVAGKDGNALQFTTVAPASGGYYNFWAKAITVDLSTFGGGLAASDDDLMHLWVRIDRPDRLAEIQVFLVVSSGFSTAETSPPGVSTTNADAYVKTFRASDFTGAVEQTTTTLDAIDVDTINRAIEGGLPPTQDADGTQIGAKADRVAAQSSERLRGEQAVAGRSAWTEYGVAGLPLRRGDFIRIGGETSRDWSDITGIVVLVKVKTATVVNVTLDHFFLRGGYGLDSSEPDARAFDVRSTNYDPRTGAEGNGSPIQAEANWLNPLRGRLTCTPAATGDAALRQRFYVRGGLTLTDNWYFAGTNAADGGALTFGDNEVSLLAAGVMPTEHFQPVPTVNESGTTVLAQPVHALWGPVAGLLFACGDPYRPGHVYNCIAGQYDHWPSWGLTEVCAPGEELMNGCVYGAQSWVFSRQRLYQLLPSANNDGTVTALPTECRRGLVGRWAFCVYAGQLFGVSGDCIFMTSGGPEEDISSGDLWGLFHGETVRGYAPIDWTQAAAIRLNGFDGELWFHYQDTGGVRRTLIRGLTPGRQFWRSYQWGVSLSSFFTEDIGGGQTQLLCGGRTTGATYTHSGFSDDGTLIAWACRTGARDQGAPRQDKLYAGDLSVSADRGGATITVQPWFTNEETAGTSATISTGTGRQFYPLNALPSPQEARNVAWDVSSPGSLTARATLYWASFPFQLEAAAHIRWETARIDHGMPGVQQVPLEAFVTLQSTATVTLTVTAYRQDGTSVAFSYTLASTSGARIQRWVPFDAMKGVLFHYLFTSTAAFKVYWTQSLVHVMPWGAPERTTKFVLGAEAGSATEVDPALAASRAGGQ